MTIEQIKKYMKNEKISQIQLSQISNIPLQTIRKIFSGNTPNPRIDTMQAIENALGLNKKAEAEPQQNITLDTIVNELRAMPLERQKALTPLLKEMINTFKK